MDETNGAEAAHPCDQFPVTYERLTTDLKAFSTLPTNSLPARAVETIERCSERRPYGLKPIRKLVSRTGKRPTGK